MTGPNLREMTHLIHTEYSLLGNWIPKTCQHPKTCQQSITANACNQNLQILNNEFYQMLQAFKMSMWSPTVTGSPIENACRRL